MLNLLIFIVIGKTYKIFVCNVKIKQFNVLIMEDNDKNLEEKLKTSIPLIHFILSPKIKLQNEDQISKQHGWQDLTPKRDNKINKPNLNCRLGKSTIKCYIICPFSVILTNVNIVTSENSEDPENCPSSEADDDESQDETGENGTVVLSHYLNTINKNGLKKNKATPPHKSKNASPKANSHSSKKPSTNLFTQLDTNHNGLPMKKKDLLIDEEEIRDSEIVKCNYLQDITTLNLPNTEANLDKLKVRPLVKISERMEKKKFQCQECEFSSNYFRGFKIHIGASHRKLKSKLKDQERFEKKENEERCVKVITTECYSSFATQSSSNFEEELVMRDFKSLHKKLKHNVRVLKKYKCPKCKFNSKFLQNLKIHIKMMHSKYKRNFKRYFDNKLINTAYSNKTAISLINSKRESIKQISLEKIERDFKDSTRYKCTVCSFTSNFYRGLKIHMGKSHVDFFDLKFKGNEDDITFQCSKCEFVTQRENDLKRHCLIVHIKEQSKIKTGRKVLKSFNHKHIFASKHLVKNNLSTNTGKKFKCPTCDFESKFRSKLRRHKLIHFKIEALKRSLKSIENRPFRCAKCGFSSRFKRNLLLHELKHIKVDTPAKSKSFYLVKSPPNSKAVEENTDIRKPHNRESLFEESNGFACDKCSFTSKFHLSLKKHKLQKHPQVEMKEEKSALKSNLVNCNGVNKSALEGAEKTKDSKVTKFFFGNPLPKEFLKLSRKESFCTESQSYQCSRCSFASGYFGNLTRHFKNNHLKGKYKVKKSQNLDIKKSYLSNEKSSNHDKVTANQIRINGSSTRNASNMRQKTNRSFHCPKCNYISLYKGNMKKHSILYHLKGEKKNYNCSLCEYSTNLNAHFIRHQDRHKLLDLTHELDKTQKNCEVDSSLIKVKSIKDLQPLLSNASARSDLEIFDGGFVKAANDINEKEVLSSSEVLNEIEQKSRLEKESKVIENKIDTQYQKDCLKQSEYEALEPFYFMKNGDSFYCPKCTYKNQSKYYLRSHYYLFHIEAKN